jgi:hypothetical protein
VKDRFLTVLVVPHDEKNVRRLRVSYRLLKAGMIGAMAALVLAYHR